MERAKWIKIICRKLRLETEKVQWELFAGTELVAREKPNFSNQHLIKVLFCRICILLGRARLGQMFRMKTFGHNIHCFAPCIHCSRIAPFSPVVLLQIRSINTYLYRKTEHKVSLSRQQKGGDKKMTALLLMHSLSVSNRKLDSTPAPPEYRAKLDALLAFLAFTNVQFRCSFHDDSDYLPRWRKKPTRYRKNGDRNCIIMIKVRIEPGEKLSQSHRSC